MKTVAYNVIGLMSGTSLDGLDIAFCQFEKKGPAWQYKIIHTQTIPYVNGWKKRLAFLHEQTAFDFVKTDIAYGHFIGKKVRAFIQRHRIKADFVASHGHTIFHQPSATITSQAGHGAAIAAECGLPVVCDFRTLDVAKGGQGAPLVPIGDKLLFSVYTYCLNLGGIANVSFEEKNKRIAYDIGPANMVLNYLAREQGFSFDKNGHIASSGKIDFVLLKKLNALPYFKKKAPKSLGREWVFKNFIPLLENANIETQDKLATVCEHIAMQAGKVLTRSNAKTLITGGGALNGYLVERIKYYAGTTIVIPDKQTVQFKEALIFAFLGVLRMRNENNCLKEVTGAKEDSTGGAIYAGRTGSEILRN